MSSPSLPVSPQRIGAYLNALGTLMVIGACFWPIAYFASPNGEPLAISLHSPNFLSTALFDVLLLYGTIFFEGILLLDWTYILLRRKDPLTQRTMATIITLIGIGLSVVIFGTTLLSEANLLLVAGFWLLVAGYAVALAGVLLLHAPSWEFAPKTICGVLVVVSVASGVAAASNVSNPQFLRCTDQGNGASGALIFSADSGHLKALHVVDGSQAWTCDYFNHGITPLANTDSLLIGLGGTSIFAMNMADGGVRWRYPIAMCPDDASFTVNATALNDDTVFLSFTCKSLVSSFGGRYSVNYLVALRLVDGTLRWQQPIINDTIMGTTTDAVLLAQPGFGIGSNGKPVYAGQIFALRSTDGMNAWHATATALAYTPSGIVVGQPDGTLALLNPTTGALIWRSPVVVSNAFLGNHSFRIGFSQIFDNDNVYIIGDTKEATGSELMAVQLSDGKHLWSADMGSHIDGIFPGGDAVFVRVQTITGLDMLRAVRPSNGTTLWSNAKLYTLPATRLGNTLYFLDSTALDAVNATNGTPLWSAGLTIAANSLVGVANGMLYLSGEAFSRTDSHTELLAVRASDGATLWQSAGCDAALLP